MTSKEDVEQTLRNTGLKMLGIASPFLAVRWTTGATPSEGEEASLSLTSEASWVAPAGGVLSRKPAAQNMLQRIVKPDGTAVPQEAAVLRLHPQVYLRLARLYAKILEGRDDGQPVRPVPYYFVYTNLSSTSSGTPLSGSLDANTPLNFSGTLTIHDPHGLAIDPVAVAGVFKAFVEKFDVLEARDSLSQQPTQNPQIGDIAKLGDSGVRLHLVDPHGRPNKNENNAIEGLQEVKAAAGLFSIKSDTTTVKKASTAPENLRLGPATNGALDTSFAIPSASVTLHRDFLRVMLVDLKPFLIGERPSTDKAAAFEPLPEIRHNETVTFTLNGNALLGAANQILSGSPPDSLVVSPVIHSDFTLPEDGTDAKAQWPDFPKVPEPIPDKAYDPIPASLRDGLAPSANFITGTEADVALTLKGLTPGQAVRVYNRKFLRDAREGRGDGAGAVVTDTSEAVNTDTSEAVNTDTSGVVKMILKDPLGLVQRGSTTALPQNPTLHVDVVVLNHKGKARVFGNVTTNIEPPAAAPATSTETNPFGSATDRGIASAGILGLPAPKLPSASISSLDDIVNLAKALSGEGDPREAPRLPTMARRDAIVASGKSGTWQGQVSGAHFIAGLRNAQQRVGSPGSPGGPEFQTIGIQTNGGLLAYDMARAALRRTRHIIKRLIQIEDARWEPPTPPSSGSFSGALLQTVAPVAETPELAAFPSRLEKLPLTWSDFVDKDLASLLEKSGSELTSLLESEKDKLKSSAAGNRLYDEFKRDFSATVHGRRDALWALQHAISSAREFIYIEGPAFTATDYGTSPLNDLVTMLKKQLESVPGLQLLLCLSKELDYGPGYEAFAAREYAKRQEAINLLKTSGNGRVVAFHPIGFPGRPLRLMTNVIIVDDVWAMVGTSTFRRRGLTFDGGLDAVFFDRNVREGRSVGIADLRRSLMAGYLGVKDPEAGSIPHPSWVRLADGYNAFSVFDELLKHGGIGVIEPLWVPKIAATDFLKDDVADPEGRDFNTAVAMIVTALTSAATPPPPPP